MRRVKATPPAGLTLQHLQEYADGLVLADLELKVVTPMFGGGVDPGEIDTEQIVRPAAIRGQLRFWWRACNAAGFETLEAMHRQERLLWGSAAQKDDSSRGPGVISVSLRVTHPGSVCSHRDGPNYVLWPFDKQKEKNIDARPGRKDVAFQLKLAVAPHAGFPLDPKKPEGEKWPDADTCQRATMQALWAWIMFGGVGSRTRRGCGTLHCVGNVTNKALLDASMFRPPKSKVEMISWLEQRLHGADSYVSSGPGKLPIASLNGCKVLIGSEGRPTSTWDGTIESYKAFVSSLDKSDVRGELGLPRAKVSSAHDRMASPIVMKALPTSAQRSVSLVLLMNAPLAGIPGGATVRDDFLHSLSPQAGWTVVP